MKNEAATTTTACCGGQLLRSWLAPQRIFLKGSLAASIRLNSQKRPSFFDILQLKDDHDPVVLDPPAGGGKPWWRPHATPGPISPKPGSLAQAAQRQPHEHEGTPFQKR